MRISDWSSDVCSSDLLAGLTRSRMLRHSTPEGDFLAPETPEELAETLAALPAGDSWILAGGTDVGLWVTKQQRSPRSIVSLGCVAALKRIVDHGDALEIGAGATYSEAFAAIENLHPDLEIGRASCRERGLQ